MNDKEAKEYVEKMATELGEHFDSAQVMVSWNEEGITKSLKRGSGSWYARQGMAHEFITENDSQIQADHIAGELNGPDDEDEAWKK